MALVLVAHHERIAVCKVRRDLAVIGHRNIGAVFPKLHVVSVVLEAMRKQTSSQILAARHGSKKHRLSPKEVRSRSFYKRESAAVSGVSVEKCACIFAAISLRTPGVLNREPAVGYTGGFGCVFETGES